MARGTNTVVENNFSKGLITEANAMSFPENACTETLNCVHHPMGSVTRRLGFDYENNYSTETFSRDDSMISEYIWKSVGGVAATTFLVSQYGGFLRFFVLNPDGKLSHIKPFIVDLSVFKPAGSSFVTKGYRCQFSSGNGYLFVTSPVLNSFYISYNASSNTITTTEIDMKIRDFEGVEDGLLVDERPLTLSDLHKYNLYNQGWYRATVLKDTSNNSSAQPLTWFFSEVNKYPSNAEAWWFYKTASTAFAPAQQHDSVAYGNTPAPKGHYIINPFIQSRNDLIPGLVGVPGITSDNRRPRATAFYAGRVWYGGVDYKKFTSNVYFSQIIERDEQIGYCYQLNDPTSEDNADLLPTDGGVISITDAGTIIKMIPLGASLYVFASNGVWSISGSSGTGFSANDYSVQKISSVSSLSETSFADIGSSILWWNNDGIYGLQINEVGTAGIQSLSEKTIKSFFQNIPAQSILNAKAAFNPLTGIVQWIYNRNTSNSVEIRQNYNTILNFDTTSGAFYHWTVDDTVKINGIVAVENIQSASLGSTRFYYLVTKLNSGTTYTFTIATNEDTTHKDWTKQTGTGVTFFSRFSSGYKLYGDGNKKFQSNYITVYLNNISEEASMFVTGVWDFAKNDNEKRWSQPQQAYLFYDPENTGTVTRKFKLRGHGKAIQIRCSNDGNAPFEVLGWSLLVSGNSNV